MASEQTLVINHGLVTQYNPLSSTQGGLATANDCVIRRERVIETRRGYSEYASVGSSPSELLVYDNNVVVHQGTTLSYGDGSGGFDDYAGSYSAPSGNKIRGAEARGNLYFTTSEGLKVVSDTAAVRSITGDTSSGTNTILNASSITNINPGNSISGTGIASGTLVTDVSGTTITLSKNTTATNSGVALTVSSIARPAGAPRALDPSHALVAPVGTGFISNNEQCAYRVLITRTDQNDNVVSGYPSQRMWVTNTAGAARNVTLTIYLPSDAMVGDKVEVYRTTTVAYSSTDDAGDEMYLVYSFTLTAAELPGGTPGYLEFTDVVSDELAETNQKLYTSASQEGILQANEQPPLAKDIALYKSDFLFMANTQTKQRLFYNMVSALKLGRTITGDLSSGTDTILNASSTAFLEVGMKIFHASVPGGTTITNISGTTITMSANATGSGTTESITFVTHRTVTLAGTTYSFSNAEASGTGVIQVYTTGVAATDIDNTARSMVRVINRYSTNTSVYAYYLTTPSTLPGQIMIEERSVGGSAFTFQVSNAQISDQFDPPGPVSTLTSSAMTSSNDVKRNGLYYSKAQQMEHVPGLNFFPVGPSNKQILRIVALRDSLIIIKEEGIYRLTGDSPQNFDVIKMDDTVFCKGSNTVRVLSNNVFMLSNQGVVAISDTGVRVVSREIEPNILPLLTFTDIATYAYGFSYESERSYFLSCPTVSSDAENNQTYVYNVFTKAWSRWTFGVSCAVVEQSADRLYLCRPSVAKIYRERKSFSSSDYSDPDTAITITSVDASTKTVVFTVSGATPQEGWTISQGGTEIPIASVVEGLGEWTAVLTQTPPSSWAAGAGVIYPKISMEVVWLPWDGGDSGILKQVAQVSILLDNLSDNTIATGITATFSTDVAIATSEIDIDFSGEGWGTAPWGEFPWGGTVETYAYPTYTPRNSQYCRIMNVGVKQRHANEKVSINGVSFTFVPVSERTNK